MPALSINTLISHLPPGQLSPWAPGGPAQQTPTGDTGVVFTRAEPWRNVANGASRVGYSRQDARGGVGRGEEAAPPGADPLAVAVLPAGPDAGAEAGEGAGAKGAKQEASSAPVQPAKAKSEDNPAAGKKPNGEPLSRAELDMVRQLQQVDQAVKAHELAHLSAAGGYARGGATFSYQRGPDGQNYAVGGEVQIDTGKERTPEATILKMQIIRQAALAPADPSPQDQRVAAHATLQIAEASKELFQARSTTTSQPSSPTSSEEQDPATADDGAARKVYQEAGAGVASRPAAGPANSRQGYAAYRTPYPTNGSTPRPSGVDQIA